jgi:molecular chaperone DnaK
MRRRAPPPSSSRRDFFPKKYFHATQIHPLHRLIPTRTHLNPILNPTHIPTMKTRETIDYGIDLGTTNSATAVVNGLPKNVKVFRTPEGQEYTPSVVHEDRRNRLIVGMTAKARLEQDPGNTKCEFKTHMGMTGEGVEREFERSKRRMTPVQLSTEVLKALRAQVEADCGEVVERAVITVPAAFELPSCEATQRAAEAAGFKQIALLQEPTAAALAYLEDFTGEEGYWLVFDFGGGTFDAAVVRLTDGSFIPVSHAGDNDLGGKLIDWAIVNELFIPALTKKFRLSDFRRGVKKWGLAMAKLKDEAEKAKIQTTTHEVVDCEFDLSCQDGAGTPVRLEFTLLRADVNRLCESYIRRALEKSRDALREAKLRPQDVKSVLLVGGPTLMPCFRQALADPQKGLGVPLDHSQDPLTVVARGAAKYARRQEVVGNGGGDGPVDATVAQLDLNMKAVGPEVDPTAAGQLTLAGTTDFTGWAVEFTNTAFRPPWRSGRIGLSPEGKFFTTLEAEKGPENVFLIELFDAQGNGRAVTPDRKTYLVDTGVENPPLINSIGVELVGGIYVPLLTKGATLPARKSKKFHTAFELKKGHPLPPIVIIKEGENPRAVRNPTILEVRLKDSDLPRDLPAGTEVLVKLEMNKSRLLYASVFIADIDADIPAQLDFGKFRREADSAAGLRADFQKQRERLEAARKKAREMNVEKAQRLLLKLDADRLVPEIETTLASAEDIGAAATCVGQLRRLAEALDAIEDALAWPETTAAARKSIETWDDVFTDEVYKATAQEKAEWAQLKSQLVELIDTGRPEDAGKLGDVEERMVDHANVIYRRSPIAAIHRFRWLEKQEASMTNAQQATAYLQQGRRAIESEDWDALRSANAQLTALLPKGAVLPIDGPVIT